MSTAQSKDGAPASAEPVDDEVVSELLGFMWRTDCCTRCPATRPSVNEYLREQHRRNALERLLLFEYDTLILKNEVENLRFRLFLTNLLIVMAVCITVFLRFF